MVTYRAIDYDVATSNKYVFRTASVPDGNADISILFRAYLDTADGNEWIFSLGANSSNVDELRWHASNYIRLICEVTGSQTTANGSTLTTGWHDIAMVRSGNFLYCYVDGVQDSSVEVDVSSRTATSEIRFGRGQNNDTVYTNQHHYAAKVFERALSLPEVIREHQQISAWSYGPWGVWPELKDDISGNGRTLTHSVAINSVDPPDMAFDGQGAVYDIEEAAGGVTGTSAFTLPVPTSSGSGKLTYNSTGAFTLPIPTSAGTGKGTYNSVGAFTLPIPTSTGSGKLGLTSTSAFTLPILTSVGVGELTYNATASSNLPIPTMTGEGTVTGDPTSVTGTGEFTLLVPTSTGSGNLGYTGTSAITIPLPVMSGAEVDTIASCGTWSATQVFNACDEWKVLLSGPAANNPRARIVVHFRS